MAEKWADLKKLSDPEIIAKYDAQAPNTGVGTGHYEAELRDRHQSRIAARVKMLTWLILWLTLVVTLATIVSVYVQLSSLCS